MKLLLATFIFCTYSVCAQNVTVKTPKEGNEPTVIFEEEQEELVIPTNEPQKDEICEIPEVEPMFKEDDKYGMKYILEHIRYPEELKEMGVEGRVFVSFIVEIDGTISDVKVIRGVERSLDKEAKRVIWQMPPWIPGECRKDTPSRCIMRLPIRFKLEE